MFWQNNIDKKILKEVAKRFFIGNPVKISQRESGQRLTENSEYKLGTWAGPESNISNLFHEMAHLAERPTKIILKKPSYNWGFKYGKTINVGGEIFEEPQTDQQVMCEARVWSFQLSIEKEFGLKTSALELVESAVYLPAFCHFEFKYPERKILEYKLQEKFCVDKLAEIVEFDSKTKYTYDKFVKDWQLRMQKLNKI